MMLVVSHVQIDELRAGKRVLIARTLTSECEIVGNPELDSYSDAPWTSTVVLPWLDKHTGQLRGDAVAARHESVCEMGDVVTLLSGGGAKTSARCVSVRLVQAAPIDPPTCEECIAEAVRKRQRMGNARKERSIPEEELETIKRETAIIWHRSHSWKSPAAACRAELPSPRTAIGQWWWELAFVQEPAHG